ncbi:MAG: rod shape-determining protein MreC [Bacillota bacterium]|nr:rod shape-determining protein MreC [Bacillota bacterium]
MRQRRRLLVIGAVVFVLLGLAYSTARQRPEVSLVEQAVRDGLAPVQYAVSQSLYRLREALRTVGAIRRAQEENRRLKQVIARLRAENASLQEARRENERWRRLLGFTQSAAIDMVPAQVIGRDPTNWFGYVVINKGSRHRLRPNLPVVTEEGVVGMVRQVTPYTASVLLLLDSRSAIGGQVAESRDYVLVEGSTARLGTAVVKPLAPEIRLQTGATIITSGLGQIFPKGLVIGRIEEVVKGRYGLAPYGILRPAVNFARLEEVAVLVGGVPAPASAPADQEGATPSAS